MIFGNVGIENFSKHLLFGELLRSFLKRVSGRSEIKDFEDVFHLDIQYIENWSLSYDLKLVLKTIAAVLQKAGAY